VSQSRYLVRPRADGDLEDQAYYYSTASAEVGHRFLVAAHDTFSLLATQPDMGWDARLRHPRLKSLRVFRVAGFEKILVLYLPVPDGVEIVRVVHGSRDLEGLLNRRRPLLGF
jgi:toxin ParE1/3/4